MAEDEDRETKQNYYHNYFPKFSTVRRFLKKPKAWYFSHNLRSCKKFSTRIIYFCSLQIRLSGRIFEPTEFWREVTRSRDRKRILYLLLWLGKLTKIYVYVFWKLYKYGCEKTGKCLHCFHMNRVRSFEYIVITYALSLYQSPATQ